MKVSEYASDVNLSVAEILKKCHELAINVNNKDDYLTDDDIIMLDNTINLISTDDEITFEEEEDIEDKVDEIMTSSRVDKSMKDSVSKEKLKKKDTSKQDFNLKKKEMYKHKNKLMKNETDENIVLYKNGMSVSEFANVLNVSGAEIIKKLMENGLMLSLNQPIDFENAEIIAILYNKTLKREETQDVTNFESYEIIDKEEDLVKIHPVSLDGTKIKAKTSMNKLTNEQQLKIMKQHLKESIELDEEEDMELGEESGKDVISINDSDACFMKNKKGKWEFDYNGQIAVDDYKGIILASYITNNPTDYYELIPLMEQVQSNLSEIYDETPVNYQVSADNGYSTDMNTEYLEQNGFDGYISSRKLSREQKKYNLSDKPFAKDNFFYDNEMMTYIRPLGQPLYKISEYTYKNKSRISHWTKECKTCPMQLFCSKGNRCRVIQDYGIPSKIRMQ